MMIRIDKNSCKTSVFAEFDDLNKVFLSLSVEKKSKHISECDDVVEKVWARIFPKIFYFLTRLQKTAGGGKRAEKKCNRQRRTCALNTKYSQESLTLTTLKTLTPFNPHWSFPPSSGVFVLKLLADVGWDWKQVEKRSLFCYENTVHF